MKLLIATTNEAKVKRLRRLLSDMQVDTCTPRDLGIDLIDVKEGSDIEENARRKALAYRGRVDFPILGIDSAFVLQGESLDPAMVKRNALGGRDEATMTQAEIADAMIAFYRGLVVRRGGPIPAAWNDAFALLLPDGTLQLERAAREVLITGEPHGEVNPYMPLRSMYIVQATGKYVAEQTDADEMLELRSQKEALGRLLIHS